MTGSGFKLWPEGFWVKETLAARLLHAPPQTSQKTLGSESAFSLMPFSAGSDLQKQRIATNSLF
jgi:hypothetical protein